MHWIKGVAEVTKNILKLIEMENENCFPSECVGCSSRGAGGQEIEMG